MKDLQRVIGEYLWGIESLNEFGMQQAIYTQHQSFVPSMIASYVRDLYTEMMCFFGSKIACNVVSGYNVAWILAGDDLGVKPIVIAGSELVRLGMNWHREEKVQDHRLLRKSVIHRKPLYKLEWEAREQQTQEDRVKAFFNPPNPKDASDSWKF